MQGPPSLFHSGVWGQEVMGSSLVLTWATLGRSLPGMGGEGGWGKGIRAGVLYRVGTTVSHLDLSFPICRRH